MNGRIGRLEHHFRVIRGPEATAIGTARLEKLARESLADRLSQVLSTAVDDDARIYVIRRLDARLALAVDGEALDGVLTRRWAQGVAGAIAQKIASGSDDGLIRYDNQADFVAHFVVDLLKDRAWDCWYYGAFVRYRQRDPTLTLRSVLLDNQEHMGSILRRLLRHGILDAFLTMMGEVNLQAVWSQNKDTQPMLDRAIQRPLFAGALQLASQLEMWRQPQPDAASLFESYLSAGPAPADWRDRQGLAMAVMEIVRFLDRQGYLRPPTNENNLSRRLDGVLADFDWLDNDWLHGALTEWLTSRMPEASMLPTRRRAPGLTPRQQLLLDDLLVLLPAIELLLDASRPAGMANQLRLYAMLLEQAPRWEEDSLAITLIRHVLQAWTLLAGNDEPEKGLRYLAQKDLRNALNTVREADRPQAAPVFRFLAGLGDQGIEVMERLLNTARDERSPDLWPTAVQSEARETSSAGVFLLLRAILDARLPWLVASTAYPPGETPGSLATLLICLGLRLAGSAGLDGDQIDPGLGILAGQEAAPSLQALRESWAAATPADHLRWQKALLGLLAGQRMVQAPAIDLYQLELPEYGTALVAGEREGAIWPLGRTLAEADGPADIVTAWLDVWQGSTGVRPVITACRELAAALPHDLDVIPVDNDELGHPYQNGLTALKEALESMAAGRLGDPQADLNLALTAIILLRIWARWLRQFATSSAPYLLSQFIRRDGRVTVDENRLLVLLEPRPLDIILDMAGYMSDLEMIPWLDQERVCFLSQELT